MPISVRQPSKCIPAVPFFRDNCNAEGNEECKVRRPLSGGRTFLNPSEQGWLDASGLARASASFAPAGCEPSRATGAPPSS